jgi:flavin reductase (DIM6/NTAB) family NADH-FMN oxidoreductase RutF
VIDPRELRQTLGCFATGVVVVTAAYEGSEHGMTANAFTSVSLDPPLVLVCIGNRARMSRVLEPGMHFGISVLSATQREISQAFAGRPQLPAALEFTWRRGVPLIAAACAHFVCGLAEARLAGDHTLYIGAVEEFAASERAPLIFHRGSYTSLNSVAGPS